MDALHVSIVSAVKCPESILVGEEYSVADGEAFFFSSINVVKRPPRLSKVFADSALCFLGNGVFSSLVMTDRGVEFGLVPGKANPVKKTIAVSGFVPLLDDVKLNARNDWDICGVRERYGFFPKQRVVHLLCGRARKRSLHE